jgi:hypothetical protein
MAAPGEGGGVADAMARRRRRGGERLLAVPAPRLLSGTARRAAGRTAAAAGRVV